MPPAVIENPILNSPYREPARHHRFSDEGITNEVVDGRRSSSYFIPIAQPKKKGGQLKFQTEWTQDRIQETKLVNQLLDKTKKRSIAWEPTARDDEFVSTLSGNVSFTVSTWRESEALTMRDAVDRVLLRVDSDAVPLVTQLYEEARRVALKVDESLDEVLGQLEGMD